MLHFEDLTFLVKGQKVLHYVESLRSREIGKFALHCVESFHIKFCTNICLLFSIE